MTTDDRIMLIRHKKWGENGGVKVSEKEQEEIRRKWFQLMSEALTQTLADIEAQLSPKHPKKGAICEVRADSSCPDEHAVLRTADGSGKFFADALLKGAMSFSWTHYREIPTAQDAMETLRDHRQTHLIGGSLGIVQGLIDNAMEG